MEANAFLRDNATLITVLALDYALTDMKFPMRNIWNLQPAQATSRTAKCTDGRLYLMKQVQTTIFMQVNLNPSHLSCELRTISKCFLRSKTQLILLIAIHRNTWLIFIN